MKSFAVLASILSLATAAPLDGPTTLTSGTQLCSATMPCPASQVCAENLFPDLAGNFLGDACYFLADVPQTCYIRGNSSPRHGCPEGQDCFEAKPEFEQDNLKCFVPGKQPQPRPQGVKACNDATNCPDKMGCYEKAPSTNDKSKFCYAAIFAPIPTSA
ncbi:hypothetical protein BDV95DRAFT_612019 [Massariosphaeria phaeospora]|uniref:Uncharacterized protein n=1 Tax=Massariosphaeria phaeospora TaxID=100035 RepID=A0A7C8I289_9PLEO|nr:hypothetical protein BDV95DRAFT_612019 [Massariosphaeria phaeospora]